MKRRILLRELKRQGWGVEQSKHILLKAPTGARVTLQRSEHDSDRGERNVLANLKRAGFRWP